MSESRVHRRCCHDKVTTGARCPGNPCPATRVLDTRLWAWRLPPLPSVAKGFLRPYHRVRLSSWETTARAARRPWPFRCIPGGHAAIFRPVTRRPLTTTDSFQRVYAIGPLSAAQPGSLSRCSLESHRHRHAYAAPIARQGRRSSPDSCVAPRPGLRARRTHPVPRLRALDCPRSPPRRALRDFWHRRDNIGQACPGYAKVADRATCRTSLPAADRISDFSWLVVRTERTT